MPGLPEAEKEKSTRPRWCHTSLSEILCWPAGPHLQDHQSLELCEVPSCFSMLHHHLHPKETQNYRTKWLQAYGSNVRGHKVIWKKWCWPTWRTSLDPLRFAYRANRSVDDAVNMGLHYVLQYLDRPGAYVRILFVDFSSDFNTIIPNLLLPKLTQLSVSTSICHWINSFLTDRQQLVRLGKYTSSTRTISTGAPQGCVLSTTALLPVHEQLYI